MSKAEPVKKSPLEIEVRRVGRIERGPQYQWTDAYSVIVNGLSRYPWLPLREAQKAARDVAKEAGFPRMKIPVVKVRST